MNDTTKLAERIATAIETITELQTSTHNRLLDIENAIDLLIEQTSDNRHSIDCFIEDVEQVQLDMQKVNEVNILTCIEELQQAVADLKQEPVGLLFTKVI
tara:strand:+ start:277 stop:576 length:300 start_codon:yes stop_codon:yes gene_type:complete